MGDATIRRSVLPGPDLGWRVQVGDLVLVVIDPDATAAEVAEILARWVPGARYPAD
jgi:hypothetical protein